MAKRDGRLAFISSGTFARANFAGPFRQWLPTVAQFDSIIDFGENQPFPGAEMGRPSIVLLRKTPMADGFRSLFISNKVPASLDLALETDGVDCDVIVLKQPEWVFQGGEQTRLTQKIMHSGVPLGEIVRGLLFRGVTTGGNDAFIVDQATRDRLVAEDPGCSPLLKRLVQGEDLRPWYQEDEGRWLIFTRRGVDIEAFPSVKRHLERFRQRLEPKPAGWDDERDGDWLGRKAGAYRWFEIQDTIDYHEAFDHPKIFWPDISKLPRFSLGEKGIFVGNTGYIIPNPTPYLLGVLQSRVLWFAISHICQPLRLRAGLWQYRILPQFVTRLPIPEAALADREAISALAMTITEHARNRYALHRRVRHRLQADLGTPDSSLNQKLTAWWGLDFAMLRAEVKKVFKHDIPLAARDEWEAWHAANRAENDRLTAEIIWLEIELNACVYTLFRLTPEEIAIIEESTRYRYGEV